MTVGEVRKICDKVIEQYIYDVTNIKVKEK